MIELPPSKSIAARFLVATFFDGTLPADPVFEDNDDLMVLQQALLEVFSDEEPIDYGDSPIDVGASGTALRFVTAVCASSPGADYVITGTPRLMARPMEDLISILREAGASVEALGDNGCGPYRVIGKKIKGGEFSIRGNISSQFISALMLVSPYWEEGMKLNFTTPLVSAPYIEMTARLMQKFGIKLILSDTRVEVKPGQYKEPADYNVEADWSAASFFYEACALGAENVEIARLVSPEVSLQGDKTADSIFKELGVVSKFNREGCSLSLIPGEKDRVEVNFTDCPDLMLPYALACLLTDTQFRLTGIAHLRLKESDRIKSLQEEAGKLSFIVKADDVSVWWDGEKTEPVKNSVIDPHDDHRVAMSFAMAALKTGEIKISHPEVVEKSFIDFWNQIPKLGLQCNQEGDVMTISKQ